jgi:ribosomal-protein-alanine N-acetyltransferase
MIALPLKMTPYARCYRHELLSLINDGYCRLHVHLDWYTIEEWIDQPQIPIYLGWYEHKLVGAVAASPPRDGASWLRLVAIDEESDIDSVLIDLWLALRSYLTAMAVREVGALLLQPWLTSHLAGLGFTYQEDIVTLRRDGASIPAPLRHDLYIRHGDVRNLQQAVDIDHAAFAPLWQLSTSAMRQAIRESANFTLAESNGQAVGYQITTLFAHSVHLARLAVNPEAQGSGVGGALLGEMLNNFSRRGILTCSVNTQASNLQSQHLYRRYGFELTGQDMPYWSIILET